MDIDDKINKLDNIIHNGNDSGQQISYEYTDTDLYVFVFAISFPFLMFIMLYLIKPGFVKINDNVSRKIVLKYTLIATIIVWIISFLFLFLKKMNLFS